MAKKTKDLKEVKIEFTAEQMKQLAPLFDYVKAHPNEGMILGQAMNGRDFWKGSAIFKFMKPDEVHERVDKAVLLASTITPADWH